MRVLRNRNPEAIHLLTNRTESARLYMVPTPDVVQTIGGVIGRYQKLHKVKIYELQFLSNHFHILASQPEGNLWKFMTDISREIAKRVNRINGREGRLWARRYSDQVVLKDSDQLKAYAYINTNAVHHGLIKDPKDWPGLSSYNCKDKRFPFLNYSAYSLAKMRNLKVRREDYTSYYEIEISELPSLCSKSRKVKEELKSKEVQEKLNYIWDNNENGYLGLSQILNQQVGRRPGKVKKSPKPPFYSKCGLAILRERKAYKILVETYREASERFRLGEYDVSFPEFTFKPSLHYEPVTT